MMLRTTISRIKKVCTVSFVPRLLRGDSAPVSYAVLRKAPKSTKCTDDDHYNKKGKYCDGSCESGEYMFVSDKEPKIQRDQNKSDDEQRLAEELLKENIIPMTSPKPLPLGDSRSEKRQRIIDQAFGKDDLMEPILGEQYFSHSVNLDQTRREITEAEMAKLKLIAESKLNKPVSDNRVHFGVFKKNRELLKDEASVESDSFIMNEATLKATGKRGGAKESAKSTETMDELGLMGHTLNIHLTSPKDVHERNIVTEKILNADPISTSRNEKQNLMYDEIEDETLPLKATVAEAELDKYVYNQEKKEYRFFSDIQNPKLTFESTDVANYLESQPNFNNAIKTKQYIGGKGALYSTTAKENEEQLTQKIEQIDETPLVEAQKPEIEGFNIAPKILGGIDPTFNCFRDKVLDNHQTGASIENVPASFDEVAKRCLDTPTGKIDEILLKEMEKLGIPIAKRDIHARSPIIEEDLVQMDVLQKQQRRPVEKKDLDLESHEYEREAVELCSNETLFPSRYMCNEKILPETEKDSDDLKGVEPLQGTGEEKFKVLPNQVLIDPYDKKTIAYDTEEYDDSETYDPSKVFSYYYVPEAKKAESKTNDLPNDQNNPADLAVMDTADNTWGAEPYNRTFSTETARILNAEEPTTKPLSTAQNISVVNNVWNGEQSACNAETYQKPNVYKVKEIDNQFSFDPPDVSTTQNINEDGIKLLVKEQNYAMRIGDTINPTKSMKTAAALGEKDLDYKQRIFDYALKISKSSPDLSIPDGTFDKKLSSANAETMNSSLTYYNKTNINVSDGIWDEPLDPEPSTNQDHKDSKVSNEIWDEEKFDPHHVLTCNETCPIAPRPQVYAVETVRLEGTEAIFDNNFLAPHACSCGGKFNSPTRCSDDQISNAQERMKKVSKFLKGDVEKDEDPCEKSTDEDSQKRLAKLSRFLKTEAVLSSLVDEDAASKSMVNSIPVSMPENLTIPESLQHHHNDTLPKLDEDVSLSELLRRVRERSRILEYNNELKTLGVLAEPAEGKCGRKAPRCSPLAPRSPPPNPIPPPSFGLPPLKPRPPTCKPRKKPQTTKCASCNLDVSSGLHFGPKIKANEPVGCPEMVCESKDVGAEVDVKSPKSKADLTDEVIDRLQTLGKILGGAIRQGNADVLDSGCVVTNRRGAKILLARDYEPWAPIPSWPTPKKAELKKPECSPGCKIFPPPRSLHDPPCNQRPCVGFPKRTFSLLDCFSVSLGENKMYDLGEF